MRPALFALSFLLVAQSSFAGLITIEPDDYEPGEIIVDVEHGVYVYDRRTWNPITAVAHPTSPYFDTVGLLGTNGFGSFVDEGTRFRKTENLFDESPDAHRGGSALVFNITRGTNYASLLFWSEVNRASEAYINAYDIDGNLIKVVETTSVSQPIYCAPPSYISNCVFRLEISMLELEPDIYWLMAGGSMSGRRVDHLQFNQIAAVPEPDSFSLLFAAGLLGALLRRERALRQK